MRSSSSDMARGAALHALNTAVVKGRHGRPESGSHAPLRYRAAPGDGFLWRLRTKDAIGATPSARCGLPERAGGNRRRAVRGESVPLPRTLRAAAHNLLARPATVTVELGSHQALQIERHRHMTTITTQRLPCVNERARQTVGRVPQEAIPSSTPDGARHHREATSRAVDAVRGFRLLSLPLWIDDTRVRRGCNLTFLRRDVKAGSQRSWSGLRRRLITRAAPRFRPRSREPARRGRASTARPR